MIKILKYADVDAAEVFERNEPTVNVQDAVTAIIDDVRASGDEALVRYAAKFDGIDPDGFQLELTQKEKEEALASIEESDPGFTDILRRAAANIAAFHSRQVRNSFIINDRSGVVMGQKVIPLEKVGLYVPGGTAAYPSTVLMDSIPALIAGCGEIIITTPPGKDGSINPAIVAAAYAAEAAAGGSGAPTLSLSSAAYAAEAEAGGSDPATLPKDAAAMQACGKTDSAAALACSVIGKAASDNGKSRIRIFKTGGAQAVAALAYGTETIPKVDKIVGPGNAFVAEAKRQVYGRVAIDMIAGPSEILVVSDSKSDPNVVAADMLSQAEHDKNASAVLVTDSAELAAAVRDAIEEQLKSLEREEIARASIESNGKIIVADDLSQAIDIANEIAPEHLELCVDDPFDWLGEVKHAGSVFLGRNCPEALGDYFAGPNHTLPTSGTARFSSPLSVDDFVKKMQYTYYTADALAKDADDIAAFARKEGLTGHARSALIRKK